MKKYVGYIRVSNKEHDTSIPAQELKLREYVLQHNIDLVEIYVEEKSAFKKSDRKEFKKAMRHLEQDEIQGIVFHKVDRSARNMKDFAILENFFDRKDIRVIEGEFDTSSAQGRFQFRIFCSMAVWYSENLSEEVTTKMTQRLRNGYYPANPPFGYRKGIKGKDKDWKKKYPNHNARYVREIYELYDSGAHTYNSLAAKMRLKGAKNSNGGKFNKRLVERILTNPFYYGQIKWTRRATGKELYFEGNHKPLISKQLFESVKDRREGRTVAKGGYGKLTYSRMFTCKCERYLCPEKPTGRNGKRKHVYLRCHNKNCDFSSIREDHLENLIVNEFEKYQIKPKALEGYKAVINDMNEMVVEENEYMRKELNMRLAQIEKEIARVQKGYLDELFNAKEAKEMRTNLQLERTTLFEKLNKESNALDEALFKTTQDFLETFAKLSSNYKNACIDLKREILEFLFSKHSIQGGNLLLEPKPIVKEITFMSKSTNGWGDNTKSETLSAFKRSFLSLAKFIQENNLSGVIQRLVKEIHYLSTSPLYT
ncbi:recombinase RecB [Candidatus Uabimicrobium amorphum]|uniref:Recombinase RecB n=2 Tax=Uabimicrobium amorphum TaxID=2596890 RepID=A0A5S9IS40_UABAM|nr:recombinase RecB [Candidatus Uabimicrobium amorphum]